MSVKNNGKEFNDLTAKVLEILSQGKGKVQKNIKLKGPDGLREVDVLYEEKNGLGRKVCTVIECKDYGRKIDVKIVDGFVSKCKDIHADVGVLISRRGFSRTAIQKAKRENIGLQMLQDIEDLDGNSFVNEIPIWVRLLSPKVRVSFSFRVEKETVVSNVWRENEVNLEEKLGEAIDKIWNNLDDIVFPSTISELGIFPPYYFLGDDGAKIYLSEDSIELYVEEIWLKGSLGKIGNVKILTDIMEDLHNIICFADDINLEQFIRISPNEVPEECQFLTAKEKVSDFRFFARRIEKVGNL